MDGMLKTIKIGIIFYMPKRIMKAKGEKHIQKRDENHMGIFFFSIKKKYLG
jgi:hypothetical protein